MAEELIDDFANEFAKNEEKQKKKKSKKNGGNRMLG